MDELQLSANQHDLHARAARRGARIAARVAQPPAPWLIRHGSRLADAAESDAAADAPAGAAQIVLLAKGERIRMRPEHGAIWIAIGSGLHCETAWYRAWCAHGEACITEARHEVEISAPARQDSLVVGILPDALRLELAAARIGGGSPMSILFPQVAWSTSQHLDLPAHALALWRQRLETDGEVDAWAHRAIAACLEQQSIYRVLAGQCSGRTWSQKQAMLGRLLRGRIAMQLQDKPNVADGARAALLSTWRFIALHREVFGETPSRSAYQHRLEHAMQQLRAGELAVTDVAEIVGYRNRSSFSRAFKTRFGYSPMQVPRAVEA